MDQEKCDNQPLLELDISKNGSGSVRSLLPALDSKTDEDDSVPSAIFRSLESIPPDTIVLVSVTHPSDFHPNKLLSFVHDSPHDYVSPSLSLSFFISSFFSLYSFLLFLWLSVSSSLLCKPLSEGQNESELLTVSGHPHKQSGTRRERRRRKKKKQEEREREKGQESFTSLELSHFLPKRGVKDMILMSLPACLTHD